MYTDPSGNAALASSISAITLRATTLTQQATIYFSSFGVKRLIVKGILDEGQSVVVELVTNFVFSLLTGYDPDVEDPRRSGKKHTAQTGGTAAHKKLELAIRKYKPFGKYVTLIPEIYLDDGTSAKGGYIKKHRGYKNAIGIDIEVWMEGKLMVIMDLKTGKNGFTLSRARDHGNRRGGVPVIEIFMPFL